MILLPASRNPGLLMPKLVIASSLVTTIFELDNLITEHGGFMNKENKEIKEKTIEIYELIKRNTHFYDIHSQYYKGLRSQRAAKLPLPITQG